MGMVKLVYKHVAEIVGKESMFIITLTDESENRQLSVVCNSILARQLQLHERKPQAMTRQLPYVLWTTISRQTDMHFQIIINNVEHGEYSAQLYNLDLQQSIEIAIGDAILLSLIGKLPVFIDADLFYRQSYTYNSGVARISVPVNVLTDDMLKSALQEAIDTENYEGAAHLRDELKRREEDEKMFADMKKVSFDSSDKVQNDHLNAEGDKSSPDDELPF